MIVPILTDRELDRRRALRRLHRRPRPRARSAHAPSCSTSGGAIVERLVQEKGVPKSGKQKTANGSPRGAKLYFTRQGEETTDSTLTGIPVVLEYTPLFTGSISLASSTGSAR